MATPLFDTIAVIGLGLIGASICRVARQQNLARVVVGADADAAVRARATAIGLVDRVADSAAEAVKSADLVVLCTPVGAMKDVATAIASRLRAGCILSDVGSSKMSVIGDVGPLLPAHVHFIPGHPVAGTEYSGPDAGFSTLFLKRWVILTPPPEVDAAALDRLTAFWTQAGANVEAMSAGAPRHRVGDHEPRAASDRLQHRAHRLRPRDSDRGRGDEILRRRLS